MLHKANNAFRVGHLRLMHSFSVSSENITINHSYIAKNRFFGLSTYLSETVWSNLNHCDVIDSNATHLPPIIMPKYGRIIPIVAVDRYRNRLHIVFEFDGIVKIVKL